MTNNVNLFRELEPGEAATFRDWARRHYKPGEPINGVWHPVVQEECVRMNAEHFGTGHVESPELHALREIVEQREYEGFGDPVSRGEYVNKLAREALAKAEGRA